jgi:hypothetical protein
MRRQFIERREKAAADEVPGDEEDLRELGAFDETTSGGRGCAPPTGPPQRDESRSRILFGKQVSGGRSPPAINLAGP